MVNGIQKSLKGNSRIFLIAGGLMQGFNAFGWEVVQGIAGATSSLVAPIFYGVVGLSAVYAIWDKFSRK